METTYTKLGDLKRRIENKNNRNDQETAEWFQSLFKTRKKIKVRFLQELTEDAELYDASRGTFLGAVEHQAVGPQGYMRRALDTMETEGRDWAQEQHEKNYRLGWGPKENFYINVAYEAFDEETGQKVVKAAILSRPISSDFVDGLITRFEESDGRGISDKTFWIERTGTGAQTKWKMTLEKNPDQQIDTTGVECYDLSKTAVKHVPYEEQQRFYMSKTDIDWKLDQLAKWDAEKKGISYEEAYLALGGEVKDAPAQPRESRQRAAERSEAEYDW